MIRRLSFSPVREYAELGSKWGGASVCAALIYPVEEYGERNSVVGSVLKGNMRWSSPEACAGSGVNATYSGSQPLFFLVLPTQRPKCVGRLAIQVSERNLKVARNGG